MKKKSFLKLAVISTSFLLLLAGCNDKTPEVTIPDGNFVINKTDGEQVDLGSSYYMDPLTVKDSADEYHKAVISVKDSNGKEYAVKDSSFTPDHVGEYKITYTITYGNNQTMSKSYTIVVVDLSAPTIESDFSKDNLVVLGETVDLSSIKAVDNADGDLTPTISVKFNGNDVEVKDNKFVASEKGTYTINITAEDKSANKLEETFNVFTVIDGESDVSPYNEFYSMSVSENYSYNGTKSIQADWLSKKCLLG